MPGVSWSERGPTDWLASNGRWYERNKYPTGWSTSALPPAPGHGGVGSILRRFAEMASPDNTMTSPSSYSVDGDDASSGWSVGVDGSGPRPTATPNGPRTAVVPTGRRVANATITEPTRPAPASTRAVPAPPGRLGPAPTAAPPMPAPPTNPTSTNIPPPSPAPQTAPMAAVAGDLGKVLGTAKRRIEKAINDAAES